MREELRHLKYMCMCTVELMLNISLIQRITNVQDLNQMKKQKDSLWTVKEEGSVYRTPNERREVRDTETNYKTKNTVQ